MLAFLLGIGDYLTPAMVGGLDGMMLGMVIASQFWLAGNWPLGATQAQTFCHVLLPMISSAVIGGALLGLTLPVDEVIVTLFLTGIEPTLPVYAWNQMRFGFSPSVNAIFTLIGCASIALILPGIWVMNWGAGKTGGADFL